MGEKWEVGDSQLCCGGACGWWRGSLIKGVTQAHKHTSTHDLFLCLYRRLFCLVYLPWSVLTQQESHWAPIFTALTHPTHKISPSAGPSVSPSPSHQFNPAWRLQTLKRFFPRKGSISWLLVLYPMWTMRLNIIGSVLSADVFFRFCKARGYPVLVRGTDEYGTATETVCSNI